MTRQGLTEAIELRWQPDVDDYVAAFIARNGLRAWLFSGILAAVGVGFAGAAIMAGQYGPAVIGVAIVGLALCMPRLVVRSSTRALWRQNRELQAPSHVVLDPLTGITFTGTVVTMGGLMKTTDGRTEHAWHTVEKVLDTDRAFVVHLTGHRGKRFFLIAKRATTGPAQLADLSRLLLP